MMGCNACFDITGDNTVQFLFSFFSLSGGTGLVNKFISHDVAPSPRSSKWG